MTNVFKLPESLKHIIDGKSEPAFTTLKRKLREAGYDTSDLPNPGKHFCISSAKIQTFKTCTSIEDVKDLLRQWVIQSNISESEKVTKSAELVKSIEVDPSLKAAATKSSFLIQRLKTGDIIFHRVLEHPALIIKTSYDKVKKLRFLYVVFLSSSYKDYGLKITTRFVKQTYATPTIAKLVENIDLLKDYKHSITRTETLRVKNWIKSQITL